METAEDNLYLVPDSSTWLGPQDVAGIYSFLRHDGSYDGALLHAAGRNATIPLENAHAPYDAVQISGGAYIPLGISSNADTKNGIVEFNPSELKVLPPTTAEGMYTHEYSKYAEGKIVMCQDMSPKGSYSQAMADKKSTQPCVPALSKQKRSLRQRFWASMFLARSMMARAATPRRCYLPCRS